jgi:hypothetical protein
MNSGDSHDLWGHMLSCLQPGIWYLVDDAEEAFHPTLHRAISLSVYLYQLLLIESGIMLRHGENLRFSLRKLNEFKVHLQENLDVRYTQFFLLTEGKNRHFVCVSVPEFSKLVEQASSRQHLFLQNNQLEVTYLAYYIIYPISKHLILNQS